jgi:hypothetical protein
METLLRDVHYGLWMLRTRPGFTATTSLPVYTVGMPLKHYHLKCGSSLLALLDERWAGFCPLCEMEKMYHDAQTPPKVKKRLRRNIDAYTVETRGAEHIKP